MSTTNIFVKHINEHNALPTYANTGDAGVDLRANLKESVLIAPGGIATIPTGVAFEIPEGLQCEIRSRSGLAKNNGVVVLNSPGTVDSGYRNEISVILINHGLKAFRVEPGDRIAQAVFMPYIKVSFTVVDELDDNTMRAFSGFGDSGVK